MPFRDSLLVIAVALVAVVPAFSDEGGVIATMDEMRFRPPKEKGSGGTGRGQGRQGGAVPLRAGRPEHLLHQQHPRHAGVGPRRRVLLLGQGRRRRRLRRAAVHPRRRLRRPLRPLLPRQGQGVDEGHRRLAATWSPCCPGPKAKPLGTPGGNPPSKLSGLWFGKWWYWGDYPAHLLRDRRDPPGAEDRPGCEGPPPGRSAARAGAGEAEGGRAGHGRDDGRLADRQAALGEPRGRLGGPAEGRS